MNLKKQNIKCMHISLQAMLDDPSMLPEFAFVSSLLFLRSSVPSCYDLSLRLAKKEEAHDVRGYR